MKTVGQQIKLVRRTKGLTQYQLGKFIGYSAMGVSYLESGKRKVKLEDLIKISNVLDVSVDYLLSPVLKSKTVTYVV